MHRKLSIWGRKKYRERERERNVLTRRVRERVHFWARPTMEKGSQCVGMKEWRSDTVAIPPIVDRSSALILPNAIIFHSFLFFFQFFLSLIFDFSNFCFEQHLLTTEPSTSTTTTYMVLKINISCFDLRSERIDTVLLICTTFTFTASIYFC